MKRILSLFIAVVMLLSCVSVVTASAESTAEVNYEEEFLEYAGITVDPNTPNNYYFYIGQYKYYSANNTSETPDWMLAWGIKNGVSPTFCYGVFGDYIIESNNIYSPYGLGWYIYVTEEHKYYTLAEAWQADIEGIENVFTEYFLPNDKAYFVGDADKNGELNITDVTLIQKSLAKLCELNDYMYYQYGAEELEHGCDCDRDGRLTIKDATTIQKRIANIQ